MRRDGGRDDGAAVVEYVLVSVLLVIVFLAIAQVALLIHARDILVADAAEGARTAALRDSSLADGERDCAALVSSSLSRLVLGTEAPCIAAYERPDQVTAQRLVRMRVQGTVPMTLVPFGRVHLDVSARAVVEPVG